MCGRVHWVIPLPSEEKKYLLSLTFPLYTKHLPAVYLVITLAGLGDPAGNAASNTRISTRTGARQVNMVGLGTNRASETVGGKFDNREYTTKVIHSSFN